MHDRRRSRATPLRLALLLCCSLPESRAARGGRRLTPPVKGVARVAAFSDKFWEAPDAISQLSQWNMSDVLAARDKARHSAMNIAAYKGNLAGVKALLAAGGDPSNPDVNLHRPLHHAALGLCAACPNVEIVRVLLAAGASANVKDKNGKTPAVRHATGHPSAARPRTRLRTLHSAPAGAGPRAIQGQAGDRRSAGGERCGGSAPERMRGRRGA